MLKDSLKSAITLTVAIFLCGVSPCIGQPDDFSDYFREIVVQADGLTQADIDSIESHLENHEYMQLDFHCGATGEVIFRIQSNYPKRVPAIKDELLEISSEAVPGQSFVIIEQKTGQEVRAACS